MLPRRLRLLSTAGIAALALALLTLTSPFAAPTPSDSAAPAVTPVATKGGDRSLPHEIRIKPYKYERQQRYTSESTNPPASAPCALLPGDPAAWPKGIVSCYGPAPAPPKQQQRAAPPLPTPAPPAAPDAAGDSGGNGGGNDVGASAARSQHATSSCG